ncbi:MAG: hypothetical protein WAT09_13550 [Paracoccaceae bacterium]
MSRIDFSQATSAKVLTQNALAEARSGADQRLTALVEQAMTGLTGPLPLSEKLAWPTKEAAARACLEGKPTVAERAIIGAEADERGETPEALARRIVARAESWHQASARLAGIRHRMGVLIGLAEGGETIAKALEEAETLMAAAMGPAIAD